MDYKDNQETAQSLVQYLQQHSKQKFKRPPGVPESVKLPETFGEVAEEILGETDFGQTFVKCASVLGFGDLDESNQEE